MKKIFLFSGIIASLSVNAQYYYNDIIGTQEANSLMSVYRAQKVQSVSATGFDELGAPVRTFSEKQSVLANGTVIRINRVTEMNKGTHYFKYDDEGKLISIMDTLNNAGSATYYSYDNKNRVTLIKNVITDTAIGIDEIEEHQWFYNNAGQPARMLRILNKDTTEIRFKLDADGNVIEEQKFKRNVPGDVIYYYYDDKNRLSDVVRYNKKAKRLLPDIMFEYSDANQVIQKITLMQNSNVGYLIWRYQFDDKGLKVKEANFNKDKQMIGKIEYRYVFGG